MKIRKETWELDDNLEFRFIGLKNSKYNKKNKTNISKKQNKIKKKKMKKIMNL